MNNNPEKPCDVQDFITTFITPFDEGAGEKAVIDLIDSSQRTIKAFMYGFTSIEILEALLTAKSRGIIIQILMDSTEANTPTQKPLVNHLKKAGIEVLIGKSPVHSQLIHLKSLIIDESIVMSGSWNFGDTASSQINVIDIVRSKERAKVFLDAWDKLHGHLVLKPKEASMDWNNSILVGLTSFLPRSFVDYMVNKYPDSLFWQSVQTTQLNEFDSR